MKRYGFRGSVALLMFVLGVGAAWGWARLPSLFETVKPSPVSEAPVPPAPPTEETRDDEVRIELRRTYREQGTLVAEFEVTNGSREILSYFGYSKDHNVMWSIRRGSRSEGLSQVCGTGLNGYSLHAGQSATFRVDAREAGKMQVGFEFFVGDKGRRRLTIWSKEVLVREP